MTPGRIVSLIVDAYESYISAYDVAGSDAGVCFAITRELSATGLVDDTATGEASIEAQVERVFSEHIIDTDGRVIPDELATEIALALQLVTPLEVAA